MVREELKNGSVLTLTCIYTKTSLTIGCFLNAHGEVDLITGEGKKLILCSSCGDGLEKTDKLYKLKSTHKYKQANQHSC